MKDEIPRLKYLNSLGVPQYAEKKIPSILAADAKHHLPPGSDLWMWAHGLIQTLLEDVPRAHHVYTIISENWRQQEFIPIYDAAMQSHLKQDQDMPIWKIMDTFVVVEDPVIEAQQEQIREFIKTYFNSERNIANHRLRVSVDLSPYLVSALCFRSQSDCFHLDLTFWETQTMVRPPQEMNDPNSRYRRMIMGTMTDIQAHLTQNKTITRWARIWRLCRVNPGRINLAADQLTKNLYPDLWDKNTVADEVYISKSIRPVDKATGYL